MRPRYQSRFSDKIIAVSESTKNDLVNLYKLDPARVSVIHSGISPLIKRPDGGDLEGFRIRNNLPKRFILFLGKLEPRKNIPGLIKAFNILKREENFKDLHLVLAGARGWLYEEIFIEIANSRFKDSIIVIDNIPDNARSYYYSLAEVFVYPSFFEGFGFPPLEAMACGTPVVVSNNSSLPEVVGGGGLMIDPYNIREIASAISLILSDKALKAKFIYEGLGRIKRFNWQKTAEETLNYLIK
jgi:glycosyltransferase involved in cell wall biosynthesis